MLYETLKFIMIINNIGGKLMTHPKVIAATKNLGLDLAEYKDFFAELETSVQDLLNETRAFLSNKDGVKASETIHSIKGSVGSLGLMDSYQHCQTLENEYKKGVQENSMVLLEEFIRIYHLEFNEIKQTL